jgi:hypothetical protein
MPEHHDDDPTPAHRGPALSAEALNMLDLALALHGTAVTLREAARRYDEAEAAERHEISVSLEFQLAEIRDSCDAASAALRSSR